MFAFHGVLKTTLKCAQRQGDAVNPSMFGPSQHHPWINARMGSFHTTPQCLCCALWLDSHSQVFNDRCNSGSNFTPRSSVSATCANISLIPSVSTSPCSKLPSWARAVVPKIFYVTEKAWNYYPYTITGERTHSLLIWTANEWEAFGRTLARASEEIGRLLQRNDNDTTTDTVCCKVFRLFFFFTVQTVYSALTSWCKH